MSDQLAYSVKGALDALGGTISRTKLYDLISSGEVESTLIGRKRVISAESLAALARNGSTRTLARSHSDYVRARVHQSCAAQGVPVTPPADVLEVAAALLAEAPATQDGAA